MNKQLIRDNLITSLEDFYFSKDEKKLLKKLLEEFSHDLSNLNFTRNLAFSLVEEGLRNDQANALSCLKWLENVVKAIDGARGNVLVSQRAYFSPGTECRNAIISLIKKSKHNIEVCVFTISDDKITHALVDACRRGVAVKVISDNDKSHDKGSDIEFLSRQGIAVKLDQSPNHMHHKFAIFDRQNIVNGSFNWTRSASNYNEENIVVSNDQSLLKQFSQSFDSLWLECKKLH